MVLFFTVFASVFLAELGDKTQIATLLFSADGDKNRLIVFFGAAAALTASTALAVLLGRWAETWLSALPLNFLAGVGFILIGLWTIFAPLLRS